MKAMILTLALAAIPSTAMAAAAPDPNRDVRCLMLANLFSKAAPDANGKEAARQARLFYLGRVSLRYTPAKLEAAMNAEAKGIDAGQAGTDMNKCLASVEAGAAAAEAAGKEAKVAAFGPAAAVAGPKEPEPGAATGR